MSYRSFFLLSGLIALAACEDSTSPVEPRVIPARAALAKGGNGGGGNGGGTIPAPTGRLYFSSDLQSPGNFDIYAVNPDGTGLARLTTAAGDDFLGRAATTTGRVAFLSDRSVQRAIYTMNPDGSNQQSVYTLANGTLWEIALSADGTRIAFTATISGQTDVWTIGIDGTGLTRVTNDAVVERTPAWAPNSRELLYTATVNGVDDIFVVSVSRGTVTKLTNGNGAYGGAAYSPDGRDIVFSVARGSSYELYTMRSSGSNQTLVFESVSWNEVSPVYSLDGRYIAYLSYLGVNPPGLRYFALGTTGQTGPVAGGPMIMSVSWGM
jgi:WD40 repeat protein